MPDTQAETQGCKHMYVDCGYLQPFCTLLGHASNRRLSLVNQSWLNILSLKSHFQASRIHLQTSYSQPIAPECLGVTVETARQMHGQNCVKTFSVPCCKQCLAGYRLSICNNCSWDHPRKQLLLGTCHTPPARHLRSCPSS